MLKGMRLVAILALFDGDRQPILHAGVLSGVVGCEYSVSDATRTNERDIPSGVNEADRLAIITYSISNKQKPKDAEQAKVLA